MEVSFRPLLLLKYGNLTIVLQALLDHERPLDVDLLDSAVQTFYTGDPATVMKTT
jgi:hypothetical protein